MSDVISYDFGSIETMVRGEIYSTATRLNRLLADLKKQIAPLQSVWTADAALAYQDQQTKWNQSAAALNEILTRLGGAVGAGTTGVADADAAAAKCWYR